MLLIQRILQEVTVQYHWTFDETTKTVTISGYGRMMLISDPMAQYPFNEVVEHAVIEEGVTSVDEEAFRDCVNLQSVSFRILCRKLDGMRFMAVICGALSSGIMLS